VNILNTSGSDTAKPSREDGINSRLRELKLLGLELEYASGVRAVAAEQAMNKRVDDPDSLFEACDKLVGNDRMFESYDDRCNPHPTDFVLGEGCPFDSLEAYLKLREQLGRDWLVLAMVEYAARLGSRELRHDPARRAKELVARARSEYARWRRVPFQRFFAS
jgi:hypothetical protein